MSTRARRIVLTGFMCAGKTTVARALAARLDCASLDTDEVIVRRTGRRIEAIIKEDGEARFRQIEREVLRDCLEDSDARVIALGGGAWTLAENRAAVAAHEECLTIWLDAPFDICWGRIAKGGTKDRAARPLARDHERALALYTARRDLYALATRRVEAGEARTAEEMVAEIMSIIERENFAREKKT